MGAKQSQQAAYTADNLQPSAFGDLTWDIEDVKRVLEEVEHPTERESEAEDTEPKREAPFSLEELCPEYGMTSFHYAAEAGHTRALGELLARRRDLVDILAREPTGRVPHLDMADEEAFKESMKQSQKLATPFEVRSRCLPASTPLHLAARHDRWEAIELLLSYGANVIARDEWDRTPLHLACQYGAVQAAESLVRAAEEAKEKEWVDAVDRHGLTPMHYLARGNDYPEHVPLEGKERTHYRRIGNTVVVYKSEDDYNLENQISIFNFFVTRGVNPEIEDNDGHTPLFYAAKGNSVILQRLMQMGCNPEGRIGDKLTRYRMWLNGNKYGRQTPPPSEKQEDNDINDSEASASSS